MSTALVVAACYLMGSIPFGWLLSRSSGHPDLRTQGSGNIGATNVLRVVGWRPAIAALVLDAGKGGGAGTGKAEVLQAARDAWPHLDFPDDNAADAAWLGVAGLRGLGIEVQGMESGSPRR